MIITVTLNPCIDKVVKVEDFKLNSLNRCFETRTDASGKGINVSAALSVLGSESLALGFLGIKDKEFYDKTLKGFGVKSDFVFVNANVRINTKIIDIKTEKQTDVNEKGFFVSEEDKQLLISKILQYSNKDTIFCFSGSMPLNFKNSDFKKAVDAALSKGSKVVIDSEKENSKIAVDSKALLIKPNLFEFEEFIGKKLSNNKEIAINAQSICKAGVENVFVSLGEEGCIFANKTNAFYCNTVEVDVKSISGAGDSIVGAFLHCYKNKNTFEDTIRLCMATSNACVMTEGSLPAEKDTIDKLYPKFEIERII